jgi:hypothetical protein
MNPRNAARAAFTDQEERMRRTRLFGIAASTVATIGLTALAITSANASSATDSGDPGDMPAGIGIQQTEDGGVKITQLSPEEIDEGDWQTAEPVE